MPPFTLQGTITVLMVLVALISPLASALPSLRILPLGDSITKGNGSKDQKGYRNRLREKLIGRGTSVDMVGSLKHPPTGMADNDHEGHSGKVLAQINTYWKLSIAARPNVVLVHAGTNNMDLEVDLEGSPNMLASIIDGLFQNAPDTTVLVAPVIWANNPRMQKNTDRFNPQVISIIEERQKAGKHILEVPIDINAGDLSDEKHPNDSGYEKMADAWLKAILEADKRGWLKAPTKIDAAGLPGVGLGVGGGTGGAQEEIVGKIWKKQGTAFEGFRIWEPVGTIRDSAESSSREKVILADLNGDGIADYVLADKDGKMRAWINGGKPNDWKSIGYINPDWKSITGDMIRLADVDNDGKADLIALYEDGAAKVWKNVDNGKKFESLDSRWATGLASRDKVRFEDIDGDGYADYVIVYEGGAVKWARNTHNNGKDSSKKNWETETTIAPGPAGIPQDSTNIRDIDGDGKADYLVIYQGGAVKAFRNTLKEGGRNWDDLGTIAPGIEGVAGEMIRFADMDGDGLADFLAVADDGSIRMWKNLGITGTKGQSIRFADLTGEGRDDLISVDSRGRARAWINKGDNKWEAIGEIAPGFDEDLSDSRIEFIDVNGDKRADYLIIYGGGAVKAYLNNGNLPDPGDRRIWQDGITISPGVGAPGSKVRFADLDGDGYADFLILYEGGAVKYWQNNKNIPPRNGGRIWKEGIVVATGVGEPGSKVQFADLTGDGKADYIVQYDGGAARGYRNNGKIPIGEGRKWNDMGTIAAGVSPQGPVHYADINGDRKADYLVVFDGGAVNAYLNNHDWAPKLPDNPGQPIPVEPGTGGGGGGGDGSSGGGDDEGDDDEGNGGGGSGEGDDDGGSDGGSDGGNNGDKDVVYIDPKIWDSKNPTAGCQPPCTLILPPWPLSSKTTISFPVITETFKETWPETTSGVTKYGTTTITVKITLPPLTTSEIGVSNVILTESTSISVPVRGSVIPSPVTLTEPTHGITYTYKPGPLPTDDVNVGPPPGIAPGVIITAGPPGPICKSGCGKPCLFGCAPGGGGGGSGGGSIGCIGGGCPGPGGNCVGPGCEKSNDDDNDDDDNDDDDDDDEDCATETNTECHQVCTTKPCATVCNTYLGCDCTTSQVTDYWVSCESSSCTTTSTEVITGCFLTATATTTGASCPLTPVDYGDDFGDDDNALGNLGSTYKTTFSASVIVSSTPYPVNDGYATVDRTAYSIPDVESASKTKMRGTSAVILPSYVGTTISVTIKGISFITTSYPKATTTFGETTTTEPSETTTSYPTNTAINEGEAYCYEGDTNYVEFTKDEARQVIGSFCDSSYTLGPGNTFGQNVALEEDGYTVIVSAKWAPDQSGCGDKEPFSFSEDDWNHDLCLGGWTAGYSCPNDEEDRQSSYGGVYVLDPPENGGCLLLSLYAYDTSTMRLKALPKGAESLIPPVMNVTHMGEKKEWIANDKFDGRRMWPVAEGTTHGGKPSTTGVVQTKNSS
ncbi:related to acetylxylan esterase [Fusarium fujikuroi IMI 58289]|uniref:Related to acetylxylan esterase n=1 Tax=Gibberella fujikuroi (strain CBS 195.34 / IMI 58289 / NRRL A-6831) TaxID=1279085 RepID=S0DLZ1_GIBF5|nr:related to acetylxylan esterase [Fusarium fujikuroi IMI 58289]CCT63634.1 related to acetylxylan esterase [Fusarium fujikuroi IMI 58289]SCN98274.1 related to acetylxylan esterase [Fusarium fujikuroi]